MIWFCEGTKLRADKRWKHSFNKAVEVTNSNASIIIIFLNFLRLDIKVPPTRIKAQLQVHEGDNIKALEKEWESITAIPAEQFNKTIVRKKGNKPGKNRGTFKIRVYGKEIFDKLTVLLEKAIEESSIGV